jgi:hypothetical protein
MKHPLCLLPLLLAAPLCAEENSLVNLLPGDSQAAFGIDVHAVVNSQLFRGLEPEIRAQSAQSDWQKVITAIGFDPLKDLDEVLVVTSGSGQKAPALVLARGNFDAVRAVAKGEEYKGVTLGTAKNPTDGVFAFLDEHTALAGDTAMVKAAIDRHASAATPDALTTARIAEYRGHYDIWAIVNRIDGLKGYMPPSTAQNTSPFDSIDRFRFGISLKSGMELMADIHVRSAKDAEQMAATLQLFEGMTRAQAGGANGTKFAVKNTNGTLRITMAVSEDELKKTIETQRQNMLRAMNRPQQQTNGPVRVQSAEPTVTSGSSATDGGTAVFHLPSKP